jgi:nucleoid-associated protein YgaU
MVIFVPLAWTARAAPSSKAARVRFMALPARVRVPFSRTGGAEATMGESVVGRNSVSKSGSLRLRRLLG